MNLRRLIPKRLIGQTVDELHKSYSKISLKRYIEIGVSFIIFFIVGKVIIDFYMLIPRMDADIGFFMSQSMIVMMVTAGLVITMSLDLGGRLRRIERNQVDLMIQMQIFERDEEVLQLLYDEGLLINHEVIKE